MGAYEFVEYISKNPASEFPENGVRKVVDHHFGVAWKSGLELEFWKLIPRDDCICIADGSKPVTLDMARKIAYRLGVGLVDLLLGEITQLPNVLDTSWSNQLPADLKPKKRKVHRDKDKILAHLLEREKMTSGGIPVSLTQVANEVKASTGYLHYQFPLLAKKITQNYKNWQSEQREIKRRNARAEALALFTKSKAEGYLMSKKEALRILREKTDLPKNVLREEIKIVYDIVVLGITKD